MTFTGILTSTHSGLRWIVLICIVWAIINAWIKRRSSLYTNEDRLLNMFAMIFFHTQFVIGSILYFVSPKVQFFSGWMKETMYRFYGMEHVLLMTIVFILLTIGHSKSKIIENSSKKHQTIVLFYTICLFLILIAIPWPFRTALGASWF